MADKPAIKPVKQYRRGAIGVSVWRKEVQTPDGEKVFYSATASRAFKPKDAGEDDPFQYSDGFDVDDLPVVARLMDMAFMWIVNEQSKA